MVSGWHDVGRNSRFFEVAGTMRCFFFGVLSRTYYLKHQRNFHWRWVGELDLVRARYGTDSISKVGAGRRTSCTSWSYSSVKPLSELTKGQICTDRIWSDDRKESRPESSPQRMVACRVKMCQTYLLSRRVKLSSWDWDWGARKTVEISQRRRRWGRGRWSITTDEFRSDMIRPSNSS